MRFSAPFGRAFPHQSGAYFCTQKTYIKIQLLSVLTSIISLVRATAKPTPVGERDLMASFFFEKVFLTPNGMAEEFKDDCEAIWPRLKKLEHKPLWIFTLIKLQFSMKKQMQMTERNMQRLESGHLTAYKMDFSTIRLRHCSGISTDMVLYCVVQFSHPLSHQKKCEKRLFVANTCVARISWDVMPVSVRNSMDASLTPKIPRVVLYHS